MQAARARCVGTAHRSAPCTSIGARGSRARLPGGQLRRSRLLTSRAMPISSDSSAELTPAPKQSNIFLSPDAASEPIEPAGIQLGSGDPGSTDTTARESWPATRVRARAARHIPAPQPGGHAMAIRPRRSVCVALVVAVAATPLALLRDGPTKQSAPAGGRPSSGAPAAGAPPVVPGARDSATSKPPRRRITRRRRPTRYRRPVPSASPSQAPAETSPAPPSPDRRRPSADPPSTKRHALPLPVPAGAPPEFM
jgi:hypothetical protein